MLSEIRECENGRIVSLYDLMKPIPLGLFIEHIDDLLKMSRRYSYFGEEAQDLAQTMFDNLQHIFSAYEMVACVETIKKMAAFSQHAEVPDDPLTFHNLMLELRGRMVDEMKGREFFALSPNETDYYLHPTKKWKATIERFPKALADTEEAWKCFALSRYTAAVFHSLQVVEVGLIELGGFIGVNDPISGWTAVAQRLKKILDTKYQDLSQFEKDNRPFLEQVQGTVEALKNAWRNKVSHVHGKLTLMTGEEFHPDIAEEILLATRAFMRRLAEGLPKPPSDS